MGRKRNQGKARKAAKAKAREEAAEEVQRRTMTSRRQQSLATQTQQLQVGAASPHDTTKCSHMFHGFDPLSVEDICFQYAKAFSDAYYYEASIDGGKSILVCLIAAKNATKGRFAAVWDNSAKMEIVISYYLSNGTQHILEGNDDSARALAIFARYLEQCTAVGLKQTQALVNFPKIDEVSNSSDIHTLVKFLRKRIPCKCLDKKYKEVKDTAKLSFCYNQECSIPNGQVERGKTFYCSRCRCETYCSRACQKADWINHKQYCDTYVAEIAKFEAKKQS